MARGYGAGLTLPAAPGKPPDRRIDYIFASPAVRVSMVRVAAEPPAPMASDHHPVVADLEVP